MSERILNLKEAKQRHLTADLGDSIYYSQAKTELGAIDMEKKEIMQQWSDSLLLTKKR